MKNAFVYLRMYASSIHNLKEVHYKQLNFAADWCKENNINWNYGAIHIVQDWEELPEEDFSLMFDLFAKCESQPDCVVHFEFLVIAEKNESYTDFVKQLEQKNIEFFPIWVLPFKVHTPNQNVTP